MDSRTRAFATLLTVVLVMGTGVVLAPPAAAGSRSSEVLVADAAFPAALASLAGGGVRYGEHLTGRVREVDAAGQLLVAPVAEVAVRTGGQRGLLGLSVDGSDRTFATWVRMADGRIVVGQVAPGPTRLVWEGPESSRLANGGHLEFAPDGTLVVGIGDLQAGRLVDDPDRPNGKLLRLDPDGAPDQRPATISTGWNNPSRSRSRPRVRSGSPTTSVGEDVNASREATATASRPRSLSSTAHEHRRASPPSTKTTSHCAASCPPDSTASTCPSRTGRASCNPRWPTTAASAR